MQPSTLAPYQQRGGTELPNRAPSPLGAAIVGRIALEIGSQVLHSLVTASRGTAESSKLVEGVNVTLRGRSGVEILASRVV